MRHYREQHDREPVVIKVIDVAPFREDDDLLAITGDVREGDLLQIDQTGERIEALSRAFGVHVWRVKRGADGVIIGLEGESSARVMREVVSA